MKKFVEPEIVVIELKPTDIICESINYGKDYYNDRDDFIGWG